MIAVHHLENSRSHRVLWLLEELGVPYEMKRYKREPGGFAPEALKAVHPLGKSPVVVDGDVVAAESGAILEYLIDAHGGGRLRPPSGTDEHRRYVYWLHYAEGSVMPLLFLKLIVDRMAAGAPFLARPFVRGAADAVRARVIAPRLKLHLDYMESELAKAPWFAGAALTAADIQMSFPLEVAAGRAGLDASRPRLWDFLARIRERPAYKRAVERGGPVQVVR
jgi:glutathione S-transferase